MQTTAPGFQGQLANIGSTPLQLTGNSAPLNNGVTVRAMSANSTNKVYIGQQTTATGPAWANTTGYLAGDLVLNNGCVYKCIVGGTSAGSGGPIGTAPSIVDGSVTWAYQSTHALNATNGYELSAGESHLFRVTDASQLSLMAPVGTLAACFEAS